MSLFVFFATLAAGVEVWGAGQSALTLVTTPLAAFAGLVTVACSAMVYVDTRREFWNAARSFTRFFGTTLLLGAAATVAALAFASASHSAFAASLLTLIGAAVGKLAFERRIFTHLVDEETPAQTPLNKTARLLAGELNGSVRARIVCGLFGGVVLPLFSILQIPTNPAAIPALAFAGLVLSVVGEVIERYLFFSAVVTQKMPGSLSS